MSWRDLLQTNDDAVVLPWVEGRSLRRGARTWNIEGNRLPKEPGWFRFTLKNRSAWFASPSEPAPDVLTDSRLGYLVGDRFVADDSRVDPDPAKIIAVSEPVYLLELGLERFARVRVGRTHEGGPLIYSGQEMPLGPEDEVLRAFQDQKDSVTHVSGVVPALDASFRMEHYQREETRKRREELERIRREEEARLAEEERKLKLYEKLGNAEARRELATVDFGEAARAALAVGGAQYLDHRQGRNKVEKVVTFQYNRRRFECVCDTALRIVDSGICLVDHDTGVKGDTRFTLESLPGVINQAMKEGRLVVFRHVDGGHNDDDNDFDD